jgi:type I restriction enzyme, S subunit
VPEHWELKRVKYKATINDETLPETTAPDYEMLYVDISSVDPVNGIIQKDPMVFEEAPSRARRIVRDGDTIVSTVRTYLKAIASIKNPDKNLTVSTGFAVIRPRKISSDYLANALHAPSFIEEVVSRSVGVSYPAINASEIGLIKIPVPPLPEQQSIAAFLDRETGQIDTLIDKKQRIVELLKEKRTALISRAVTKGLNPKAKMKPSGVEWLEEVPEHWDVKKLSHLSIKIGSGKTPSGGAAVYLDDGILFIRSQNVYDDGLMLDDVVFISDEIDNDMACSRVKPGDVLLNITGASLGRTCIAPMDIPSANVNQHVCIIRMSNIKNAQFVALFLKSKVAKGLFENSQTGSAREGLNFEQIASFKVPLPPPSEQQSIVSFLDRETAKIDKLISKVEEAILKLKEYRTAIISAAVTGKIDVREAA